jgi:hypothetical protein
MLGVSILLLAAASPMPTAPVVLGRTPVLSSFTLEVAKKEVLAIYQKSGVAVEWSDGSEPGERIRLVVLFRDGDRFPVKTDSRALGLALLEPGQDPPWTRVLIVFPDRLQRLVSCDCPLLMGRALGRAIAHEIGHSLKYEEKHSTRGLMRAEIPRLRWSAPHRTDFYFAAEDAAAVHARLEPRQ